MSKRYIIESRNADGSLKTDGPQPESTFGRNAITGMTDWEMSRVIFRHSPNATLNGGEIVSWPAIINPSWIARPKTW